MGKLNKYTTPTTVKMSFLLVVLIEYFSQLGYLYIGKFIVVSWVRLFCLFCIDTVKKSPEN